MPDEDHQHSSAASEPVNITGWRLVPDEPTEAMWQAGRSADVHPGDSYSKVWRAMFDAAPNVDDCETIGHSTQPQESQERRYTQAEVIAALKGAIGDLKAQEITSALTRLQEKSDAQP